MWNPRNLKRIKSYLLLPLIISHFQLCKLQSDFGKQTEVNLENKTHLLQSRLNNFINFFLHDRDTKNSHDFDALINKTGLFDINMMKDLKKKSGNKINIDKIIFIEEFYKILYYLYIFHQHTFECITNKSSRQNENTICYQDIFNDTSIYRQYLSTLGEKYFPPNYRHQSTDLFGILLEITTVKKESQNFGCSTSSESIQMVIKKILDVIISIMMKNYELILYSYNFFNLENLKMQGLFGSPKMINPKTTQKWFTDKQKVSENLENNVHVIIKQGLKTLEKAPTDIIRCDPRKHEKDVTYQRFTNFIQGWVGSEEYLNKENKCGTNCAFNQTKFYRIPRTQRKKLDATVGEFDERLIENGTLYNCRIAPYFNHIYKQIKPPDFERLYHHFANEKSDYVTTWGRAQTRHALKKFSKKSIRYSFNKLTRGTTKRCKICLCQLERDKSKGIKAFSSTPVFVPSDRVVTGIRWVIKNNIVYLGLRGTKFSNNFLDYTSDSTWYTQYRENYKHKLIILDYNQRSLWLDDIIIPKNMLVSGARFIVIERKICLSIRGVAIRQNGVINPHITGWYQFVKPENETEELMLEKPDRSEFAPTTNVNALPKKWSTPGRDFIRFQPTDFKKDAAQTTVPYFDIQEVVTDPPTPLQSIGIYYKGVKGFGGFVGLKLFTANIANIYRGDQGTTGDFGK